MTISASEGSWDCLTMKKWHNLSKPGKIPIFCFWGKNRLPGGRGRGQTTNPNGLLSQAATLDHTGQKKRDDERVYCFCSQRNCDSFSQGSRTKWLFSYESRWRLEAAARERKLVDLGLPKRNSFSSPSLPPPPQASSILQIPSYILRSHQMSPGPGIWTGDINTVNK